MRQFRSPSRWTWVLTVFATVFIVACDNALEGINTQGIWGFVTVGATKDASGAHFANAEGLFFRGNLSAVPNADFTADTCADLLLTEGNNLLGVTYLDAGPTVDATLGGVARTFERTTTSQGLAYRPPSPPAYTPGDSIVPMPATSRPFASVIGRASFMADVANCRWIRAAIVRLCYVA